MDNEPQSLGSYLDEVGFASDDPESEVGSALPSDPVYADPNDAGGERVAPEADRAEPTDASSDSPAASPDPDAATSPAEQTPSPTYDPQEIERLRAEAAQLAQLREAVAERQRQQAQEQQRASRLQQLAALSEYDDDQIPHMAEQIYQQIQQETAAPYEQHINGLFGELETTQKSFAAFVMALRDELPEDQLKVIEQRAAELRKHTTPEAMEERIALKRQVKEQASSQLKPLQDQVTALQAELAKFKRQSIGVDRTETASVGIAGNTSSDSYISDALDRAFGAA